MAGRAVGGDKGDPAVAEPGEPWAAPRWQSEAGGGAPASRSRVPGGEPRSTVLVLANSRLGAFAYRQRCEELSTGFGETHKCALPSRSGFARTSRATFRGGFFVSLASLTYAVNKNGAPGVPKRRFAQLVVELDGHGLTPSWTKFTPSFCFLLLLAVPSNLAPDHREI